MYHSTTCKLGRVLESFQTVFFTMSRQALPPEGCKATKEGLMESKFKLDETDDCPICRDDWNVLCRVSNHPLRQATSNFPVFLNLFMLFNYKILSCCDF